MDIDKLLLGIDLDLGTFHAHLKRMRKKGKEIHPLDVELMQDKTRRIYDSLLELEKSLTEGDVPVVQTINLPETMPEAAIPEKVESKKDEIPGSIVAEKKEEIVEQKQEAAKTKEPAEEKVIRKVETKKEVKTEIEEPPVTEPAQPEKVEKPKVPASKVVEPKIAEKVETHEEKIDSPKSTIDLFTDSAEESIGDKLGSNEEASISQKMQSKKISSLKQAIGINEKFLFINELFGGDLGRYNNAIDEFDQMQTLEGTATHLRELKVLHQWQDKNEAFKKFKSLVERKSN